MSQNPTSNAHAMSRFPMSVATSCKVRPCEPANEQPTAHPITVPHDDAELCRAERCQHNRIEATLSPTQGSLVPPKDRSALRGPVDSPHSRRRPRSLSRVTRKGALRVHCTQRPCSGRIAHRSGVSQTASAMRAADQPNRCMRTRGGQSGSGPAAGRRGQSKTALSGSHPDPSLPKPPARLELAT